MYEDTNMSDTRKALTGPSRSGGHAVSATHRSKWHQFQPIFCSNYKVTLPSGGSVTKPRGCLLSASRTRVAKAGRSYLPKGRCGKTYAGLPVVRDAGG